MLLLGMYSSPLSSHQLSTSPSTFFPIPFQLEEPKLDVLYQVLRREEEDYFLYAGKDFMKGFARTQQVKIGKQLPLASSKKSDPCSCIMWGHLACLKEPDPPYQPFAIRRSTCTIFPWAKQKGWESNFLCNHELAEEEAREARWDLRRDRLPVWWWFQRIETGYHHRPSPQPLLNTSCAYPAGGGSELLLSQKETFGPIKWQLTKLQVNCKSIEC